MAENEAYSPTKAFAEHANAGPDLYREADADPEGFWLRQAVGLLDWTQDPTEALDWSHPPFARWFEDGKLNACHNAVDRHVEAGNGERVALHFVGEPGDTRDITYSELLDEVCRAANAMTILGVKPGDRVAIYLPMIPEAVVAMLACARIGAVHSVIFGGFSAEAIHSRIMDAGATMVITADGGFRRGVLPLKPTVDAALAKGSDSVVRSVMVVKRSGAQISWNEKRDVWWHEALGAASHRHVAEGFEAEHPLFILYTSGTTGRPKGILHTTGGYLTQVAWTHLNVFDLKADQDVYWCTADVGWITGHSYVTYGPLLNGATQVIYEGAPDGGGKDRWWKIVEDYHVSILYTSPTAVRTAMMWGEEYPSAHNLSSLRLLGSVGEPIGTKAWHWLRRVIGADRTPIVDTWWQTETGGLMISALPGVTAAKPGAAQVPLPGIAVDVVDEEGTSVEPGAEGLLVVRQPWPGMLRGLWNDPERYRDVYWSRFGDMYFAGDGARKDTDGDIWLLGRVDDVMNVSGHRLSTAEIESALVSHPAIAEAAVVGADDEMRGQAVVAFVVKAGSIQEKATDLVDEMRAHVGREIGSFAKPRSIYVVPGLPKTRSGKIMRRLLKDAAEGHGLGDTTTLADPAVISAIVGVVHQDN